jgi:glycosyltransferase involved in cell wall biosynthesis
MQAIVIGVRGISTQGGIETYCRNIYPSLLRLGWSIRVFTRARYDAATEHEGVELCPVVSVPVSALETFSYSIWSLIASYRHTDAVIHFQGVGPALLSPLARALGFAIVVRHVGADWNRPKWGPIARWGLRRSEWIAGRYAHVVVCLTASIARDFVKNTRPRAAVTIIENAVPIPPPVKTKRFLKSTGVVPRRYILSVGRLVPEKGFHTIIDAFSKAGLAENGWKLLIAGKLDPRCSYTRGLIDLCDRSPSVMLLGQVLGPNLAELYANARLFVNASSHEGMSFSLLEALSYGLPCLAADIEANRISGMDQMTFFACDDVSGLARSLVDALDSSFGPQERSLQIAKLRLHHDIDHVVRRTHEALLRAAALRGGRFTKAQPTVAAADTGHTSRPSIGES